MQIAGSSKATAGVVLDTNTQNKRKREALGEVTNNNKNKNPSKGLPKDGKIAKPHVLITTKSVRPTVKAPVRQTRASVAAAGKEIDIPEEDYEEGQDDNAMLVDEPVPHVTQHQSGTLAATRHKRVTQHKKSGIVVAGHRTHAVAVDVHEQADDADAHRAFKKRRTSSEAGDEALVETEVEVQATLQNNVVPQGGLIDVAVLDEEEEEVTGWDDLDADDADDPAMVSEYVVDIFKYLSDCEVNLMI